MVAATLGVVGWAVHDRSPRDAPPERYVARDEPERQRVPVLWERIEVSDDRRTVTAKTWYPVAGVCIKEPDGIDVEIDGEVATVAVWMRGPDLPLPDNVACTSECGSVTQSATLDEPLPTQVTSFRPVDEAVGTCR